MSPLNDQPAQARKLRRGAVRCDGRQAIVPSIGIKNRGALRGVVTRATREGARRGFTRRDALQEAYRRGIALDTLRKCHVRVAMHHKGGLVACRALHGTADSRSYRRRLRVDANEAQREETYNGYVTHPIHLVTKIRPFC